MNDKTKRTAGRPAENLDSPAVRYCVTLDKETANTARLIGGGNVSNGLRLAVKQYGVAK